MHVAKRVAAAIGYMALALERARAGASRRRTACARVREPARGRGALAKLLRELDAIAAEEGTDLASADRRRRAALAAPRDARRRQRLPRRRAVRRRARARRVGGARRRARPGARARRSSTRRGKATSRSRTPRRARSLEVTLDAPRDRGLPRAPRAGSSRCCGRRAKRHRATYVRAADGRARCSRRCGGSSRARSTEPMERRCTSSTRRGSSCSAGLVPLVVLYVLKIRRQRQRVSVDVALGGGAARSRWRSTRSASSSPSCRSCSRSSRSSRWRVALARPSTRGGDIDGDHVAIVLDTSASMATRVGGAAGHDDAHRAGASARRRTSSRSSRPGPTPS